MPDMPPKFAPATSPVSPSTTPPPPKKRRWLLYVCATLLALLVVMIGTVAFTVWWIQRPIKPVVLSEAEKAVADQKIERLSGEGSSPAPSSISSGMTTSPGLDSIGGRSSDGDGGRQREPLYVPGSKVLRLTDREINGLLNANTELGERVRLEFGRDTINAYLAVPIPEDFPIGGGRMFRARGLFRISLGDSGTPYAILEDVTIFGLSLPKAWLGGLKGENLLERVAGENDGKVAIRGIKNLRVEPGALVIEVED